MNAYQQKWLDILKGANLSGWKFEAQQDNIFINMPHITDLKLIRDNIPATLGDLSLDIDIPKERLKFIFHNGYEKFEYILNPSEEDLGEKDLNENN